MSFLGPVGSLIPVKCASQLTSSGGRSVSFQDTLGKRKAFLGNVRAREWSVDIGLAKPQELSGLRWLAENVNSPMVWYGPDAVVGNILTPRQADLLPDAHDGLEGPLVEVEPGVQVKSALRDAGAGVVMPMRNGSLDRVPVPAGRMITVSAWLRGDASRIDVNFRDIQTVSVGNANSEPRDLPGWERVSLRVVVPAGAVQLNLNLRGDQVAGPTITLTDRLLPYSPGRGAKRVVAHGLADAVIRATEDQQLQSLSFTVSEVG